MNHIDHKILEKYAKVWILAESGAPEAGAAKQVMQGMDRKYSGIRAQAGALKKAMEMNHEEVRNTAYEEGGRHWSEVYAEQQERRNWERQRSEHQQPDWRTVAANALGWAAGYAQQAFGAVEAQNIAERTKIEGRRNGSGSLSVIARFDPSLANFARLVSPAQKEMIANIIAERIRDEIVFQLSSSP